MNKMIKTLGLLGIFAVLLTAFTACSKDDDPADNDLFIGKYEGTISLQILMTTRRMYRQQKVLLQ